jgi:hypothetical protein
MGQHLPRMAHQVFQELKIATFELNLLVAILELQGVEIER